MLDLDYIYRLFWKFIVLVFAAFWLQAEVHNMRLSRTAEAFGYGWDMCVTEIEPEFEALKDHIAGLLNRTGVGP